MTEFKPLAGIVKSELIGADATITRFSKTFARRRKISQPLTKTDRQVTSEAIGQGWSIFYRKGVKKVKDAFMCPEQLHLKKGKGQPLLWANCALCGTTTKNVAFRGL